MNNVEILLAGYLFIFFARVADMSLDVIRILMLMRGKRFSAAIIGFVEVTIFVIALNEVISGGLNDPGKIIAYAGGFATGNYLGIIIEERLAMGFLLLQIFPAKYKGDKYAQELRNEGFGVTSVVGEGRDGERNILFVTLKRKNLNKAIRILNNIDPETFYNVTDAKSIHGGIFPQKKGK
ncbi:DUF2179 domain-containing protein [Desulfolucanica intricata]|uniref:DUF2179 domain-containing protein n=1 Tax=Desulfolucanica intricata TaxID=1285191 RepID=UPI00082E79C2|nr:DUF5698 domain-containing protein [Desulfolucanica intricata]